MYLESTSNWRGDPPSGHRQYRREGGGGGLPREVQATAYRWVNN